MAWVRAMIQEKNAAEWEAERDGWENKQTGRYYVTMPDYCFIGDDLEQKQCEQWDAFGECSRTTFNTTMQRVDKGPYLNFRCTLKDRPNHDFQHWRAYLYELRPVRPYDRPNEKKKRKRYLLTEEETKYEQRAKRRWSAYQRDDPSQAPTTRPRNTGPHQIDEADYTSSDFTMPEDLSDDEHPGQDAERVLALQALATKMVSKFSFPSTIKHFGHGLHISNFLVRIATVRLPILCPSAIPEIRVNSLNWRLMAINFWRVFKIRLPKKIWYRSRGKEPQNQWNVQSLLLVGRATPL